MARPIWKGNVMFGLINVPVVLYNAEQRSELHFKMLDSRDQARVRYERVNEVSGEPVPWEDVAKGYEFDDGNFVIVGDEDFKRAAPEASQTVEIEKDVPIQYYDKPYYLVPGKRGEKGYVLLRETLRANGVIGIGRVVIRTRQYLAAVVPRGNALCLDLMRYDHELRKPDEFDLPDKKPADYKITKRELDMAEMLVESMTVKWNPSKYKDDYREKLLAWIEKKAASDGEVTAPEPELEREPAGQIVDFMDLLQRSMKRKQSESPPKTKARARPAPARRTRARADGRKKKRARAS
jgi:DNA end-binding protein Ku